MSVRVKVESEGSFALIYAVGGIALVAGLAIWRAYVITVLWWWFVTPQFGVAPPSIGVAYGLLLLTSLVWYRISESKNNLGDTLSHAIFGPAIGLAMGSLVKLFV